MKKILFLCIFILGTLLLGCSDDPAKVTQAVPDYTPPTCVNVNVQKKPTIEFDYTYDESDPFYCKLFSDGGDHFVSAFKRCGCYPDIKPDMAGTQVPNDVPEGYSTDVLSYVLTNKSAYYQGLGTGFLFGVDVDPSDDAAGITSDTWSDNTSIVFAKNLYLTFPTFYQLANSKATIHEVGHMLGHMYDLDQDTGRLADTCVMIQNHYSTTDPICTVRQFCDKHACNVYANTFTTSKIFVKRSPDLNNDSKNSNLEISLKSNKNEYFQMEPIWVTVQIKNVGSDIDSVDLIGSIDLLPNFIISNAGGLQLSYHYFVVSHGAQHLIKLQPNEQTSFDMELSIGYGDISVSEKYHLLSYFSEDKYNAKIKFYNYLNHESAISNDIEFTVKAPTGVEFDNFNNLVNTVKKYDITSPDWKSYIKELKDFFTNNQSSIYSEEMYFNYIYQSVMQQKDRNIFNLKFIEECKAFFDKYPNSFYSENILKSLLPPYIRMLKISKQSFYDFLNELINKYPNTKVQTAASKLYNDKKFIKHFYK